jgi:hypothetical protein
VLLEKDGEDQLNLLSNEEVLHGVKEDGIALSTINRRKTKSIGHTSHKKFISKHVIEGKIEGRI